MNILLIAILVLGLPLSAMAGKTECSFPAGMVKQVPPNAATIAAYQWDAGSDKKGSSDHIRTLRILYKNGDHAVIQYNYCVGYGFEINYFRNRQADDLDAKAISTLIAGLYTQYYVSPEKVTFTKPLAELIASTFKLEKFDKEKDFDYGLPDGAADYPGFDLSYAISYKPLNEYSTSVVYSSLTRFNMNLGLGD